MASPHPSDDDSITVTLPSNLTDYIPFIDSLVDKLEALGWAGCDLFAVRMALEESISNAIRHGNKQDPAKMVEVAYELSPTRFWTRITDQGQGFNPEAVPDCRAPDRLEVPGGRGLTLMNAYMTHVQYNDRGNSLTLEKVLGAGPKNNSCGCE